MLAHMRKHHQESTKIHSPLGSFPPSNSATVLQFDEADDADKAENDEVDKDDNDMADNADNDEADKAENDKADKAENDKATQGNSDGAVNSPKVIIKATFMYAICDIHFESKEKVTKHMDKVHVTISQELQDFPIAADTSSLLTGNLFSPNTARQLDDEVEVLEEAKEGQEIYEEIFKIAENAISPEKEKRNQRRPQDKDGKMQDNQGKEGKAI